MGFDNYRRIESETISAMQVDEAFQMNGASFAVGSYLVKNPSGSLEGVTAEEFEKDFEKVKAKRQYTKKAKGKGEEGETEGAEGAALAEVTETVENAEAVGAVS